MRKTTSAALALCALAALAGRADEAEPPGEKAELKKLQGTWKVTKVLLGTREAEPRNVMTWTFDGDKLVSTTTGTAAGRGKFEDKWTYKVKIDTKKKPHTIELVPEQDKFVRKGVAMAGIYKIEKGELYLARLAGRAKAAKPLGTPKDFKDKDAAVYVMKREMDQEKAKE
jgi:uncharacterized protein (TIGR03067 family)